MLLMMDKVTLQNPDEILTFLADVSLKGRGMTTDSLLEQVLDEGFTEPGGSADTSAHRRSR